MTNEINFSKYSQSLQDKRNQMKKKRSKLFDKRKFQLDEEIK